ncbi:MAG: SpoIID/LytB domain-containing protein, partial [Oscillospiraceae bacterium]|nr:SpoIID/LytB domain-containing protein [Oscillospiraceae bacterium]
MKKIIIYASAFSLIMLLIPYITVSSVNILPGNFTPETDDSAPTGSPDSANYPFESAEASAKSIPSSVSVYIKSEDKTEFMNTEEYIKGVVLAEMPSSFHSEALKAQAVAARSCLLYNMEYYKTHTIPPEHNGAVICTDYTHCSAWRNIQAELPQTAAKISDAAAATENIVMLYDGKPINAVFHSTSSGITESAGDVWGKDVPYLQSVASSGDELSPKYTSVYEADIQTFTETAEKNINGIDRNAPLFSDIKRSGAGGIISLKICGVQISGQEFRSAYSLLSTNADIKEENGK